MSLVAQIPKSAIILPSNMKVVGTSPLILKKVKRSVRRFKMSKKQRDRIAAATRKFKIPILTGIAIAPATLISAQSALQQTGLINQFSQFARTMLMFYTGVNVTAGGGVTFMPEKMAVGWGPIFGILAAKKFARGPIQRLNRALSQAQIPANLS